MADPYARNMFGSFNPYYAKRKLAGKLAVVLDGEFEDRGLTLIKPSSRALLQSEIHEFILTDEETGPGSQVNRIAYVGFAQVEVGTVIVVGDPVVIAGKNIGVIAGFDETHMPNHLNIVVHGKRISGKTLDLKVEDPIIIG